MSKRTASMLGVELKIERAKKHLRELESMWQGFLATNPYEFVAEDNPETGEPILVLRRIEPLPLCLAPIVGDVVHNLRASLDHLIPQLVIANGGEPDDDATEFPIGKSKASYETKKAGKVKGISDAASEFMDRLEPYKGGNSALWQINYLDIVDKHRLVVTVASSHSMKVTGEHWVFFRDEDGNITDVSKVKASPDSPETYAPRNMPPIKIGMWFDNKNDFQPIPAIALDEPGIGEREPLIPTLRNLVSHTEMTVMAFAEGECWGGVPPGLLGVLVPVLVPIDPAKHSEDPPDEPGRSEWQRIPPVKGYM